MRYHIASLVAVFLALTIGLLLGSLVADTGVLVNRQEKLVESIREDISKINEANVTLRTQVKELQGFQNEVLPIAIRNRLVGRRVMIVTMREGQDDTVDGIKKALGTAGAQAFMLSLKTEGLNFADKNLVTRLGAKFGVADVLGGDFERLFWPRLAAELTGQQPPSLIDELTAMGLLKMDADALPVDNIIVLAPASKKPGNRDALLAEALTQIGGIRVIGVEAGDTKPSRVTAYKLRDVSTVDNIEAVSGKISLVYLLENKDVTANFGTKSTADKLIP
ncbi:MAG: copper transporter [Actinomycetota bacterium]|nr:copper transporter [Actinomycetota bacterium]